MGIDRRDFLKLLGLGALAAGTRAKDAAAAIDNGQIKRPDSYGVLYDLTRCVGCRSCEEACNEANNLPKPDKPFDDYSVFEHERRPTSKAFTVVNRYKTSKGVVFRKIQCNHCQEPACASVCPVFAYTKTPEGPVIWDDSKCFGCRYCMQACPFYIPAYEYESPNPRIRKCTMCYPRVKKGLLPACVEACPMEALIFGKRKDLIDIARERIKKNPDKYIDHIYGEHEAGGTSWLYITGVPFEEVGFDTTIDNHPPIENALGFLTMVPAVFVLWPVFLAGLYSITKRRDEVEQQGRGSGDDR